MSRVLRLSVTKVSDIACRHSDKIGAWSDNAIMRLLELFEFMG